MATVAQSLRHVTSGNGVREKTQKGYFIAEPLDIGGVIDAPPASCLNWLIPI